MLAPYKYPCGFYLEGNIVAEIKLINEFTDISTLKMRKLDWDVVIRDVPYQIVRIEGYVHTIGGHWCENDIWCYPLNEQPTYENIAEFDVNDPVCWGIKCEPYLYHKHKWGEHEIRRSTGIVITRNGKTFDNAYSFEEAKVKIDEYREHPLELDCRGYAEKCIGRKVWWRSEPAIVTHFVEGQACVILAPDGIDHFTVPPEFAKEDPYYYDDGDVKANILDKHIWWFRNSDD